MSTPKNNTRSPLFNNVMGSSLNAFVVIRHVGVCDVYFNHVNNLMILIITRGVFCPRFKVFALIDLVDKNRTQSQL